MRYIRSASIIGYWDEDKGKYGVRIYDHRNEYLSLSYFTIIFMTTDQFIFNLKIFGMLSFLAVLLHKLGYLFRVNRDFSKYFLIFSIFILVIILIFAFYDCPALNLVFYLSILTITFMNFFLYLFFSKNLSFLCGVFFAVAFLFANYGQLFEQLIGETSRFALNKDIAGELILSTAGSVLLIMYYLHKEGRIQGIVKYSYQKVKVWRLNIPLVILLLFYGIFVYLISTSPIVIRLGCSFVFFGAFFFFSHNTFTSAINNEEYRKENGYALYTGTVTNVKKQRDEIVYFHLKYYFEENKGIFSEKKTAFVYDNRLNYPIFGLSYDQIEENTSLTIVTRKSSNGVGSTPSKVWIVISKDFISQTE